jgi:hypothetical protein
MLMKPKSTTMIVDLQLLNLSEPNLRFGLNQSSSDPREGLFLFGPLADHRKPLSMRIGVIGTLDGIFAYREWVSKIKHHIPAPDPTAAHQFAFPGFESAFGTAWPEKPIIEIPIAANDIAKCIRLSDRHRAIYETVSLFAEPIKKALREEELTVDIWFVVIPDEVYVYGRPLSKVPASERILIQQTMNQRFARRLQSAPSLFAEDMKAAEIYLHGIDFHNQLKARLLLEQITTQVVRESTLYQPDEPSTGTRLRRLQDPATLAWNLCTSSFYKANGRPWKLEIVRHHVCYIGLVFKRISDDSSAGNACCGAQMFLDSGEGLVFKGAPGAWYSESSREFHLSREAAHSLMSQAVKAYQTEHEAAPEELFIHGQTYFSDEEWEGFKSAVPGETRLVGVRIRRTSEMKLYRPGPHPVLRGTAYRIHSRKALLWTSGFIATLDTYPGREVPNPLSVEIVRGDADIEMVLNDIMGLTKLNFNACIFSDGLPVTLRFANAIGEIITSVPASQTVPPLPFRHYI